jgi:tRNA pseudouridine-54 N-methylase
MTGHAGAEPRLLLAVPGDDDKRTPDDRNLETEIRDALRGVVAECYTNFATGIFVRAGFE